MVSNCVYIPSHSPLWEITPGIFMEKTMEVSSWPLGPNLWQGHRQIVSNEVFLLCLLSLLGNNSWGVCGRVEWKFVYLAQTELEGEEGHSYRGR